MKILVTGANGYLGQGIVRHLADQGFDVVATDLAAGDIDARAAILPCDLFQCEAPFDHFGRPDAVVHLAWRDGFIHNSDCHMLDLPKHYLFLKSMIASGLKRVAVMGSMHEVGHYEGAVDENTPCRPMTLYGVGKNALRESVQILAAGAGATFQWLRGYYIVGNTGFGSSVFSKIMSAAREGKAEFPFTTGRNAYDFLDYNEFCAQVAAAVAQDEVDGIINICSGKPEALASRVERFIEENHLSIRLKYGAFPDRAYDSKAIWGDAAKIERILARRADSLRALAGGKGEAGA